MNSPSDLKTKTGMMSQSRLKELLNYDSETGIFTRRICLYRRGKPGEIAGRVRKSDGYVLLSVDGVICYAHRLAWLYCNNEYPSLIDHINGDRSDNRIINLRKVNRSQNARNSYSHKDSISKFKGVTWCKHYGKWKSRIMVNGKNLHIGYFINEIDAHYAYENIARRIQGEFYKTNSALA